MDPPPAAVVVVGCAQCGVDICMVVAILFVRQILITVPRFRFYAHGHAYGHAHGHALGMPLGIPMGIAQIPDKI